MCDVAEHGLRWDYGTAKHYHALLQLPCAQQLDAAALQRLILSGVVRWRSFALPALLQHPEAAKLTSEAGLHLLQAAIQKDVGGKSRDYIRAELTKVVLEGLSALRQLTAGQFMDLMLDAMIMGCDAI